MVLFHLGNGPKLPDHVRINTDSDDTTQEQSTAINSLPIISKTYFTLDLTIFKSRLNNLVASAFYSFGDFLMG